MKTRTTKTKFPSGGSATENSYPKIPRETALAIDPKWRWHYRTLFEIRGRLSQDTEAKLHEAAEPIEPHGAHPGDSATDEFDHDLALTLLAREESALIEVNDAIGRILNGTYGICEASGVPIPARRLRV